MTFQVGPIKLVNTRVSNYSTDFCMLHKTWISMGFGNFVNQIPQCKSAEEMICESFCWNEDYSLAKQNSSFCTHLQVVNIEKENEAVKSNILLIAKEFFADSLSLYS